MKSYYYVAYVAFGSRQSPVQPPVDGPYYGSFSMVSPTEHFPIGDVLEHLRTDYYRAHITFWKKLSAEEFAEASESLHDRTMAFFCGEDSPPQCVVGVFEKFIKDLREIDKGFPCVDQFPDRDCWDNMTSDGQETIVAARTKLGALYHLAERCLQRIQDEVLDREDGEYPVKP